MQWFQFCSDTDINVKINRSWVSSYYKRSMVKSGSFEKIIPRINCYSMYLDPLTIKGSNDCNFKKKPPSQMFFHLVI